MKNIVVLVSGGGTNLQALIDAQKNGKIPNGKITCVISSNPDAYALTRAKENGIGTRVIVPKEFASREMYSKALLEALFQEYADLIVLAGFMTILDQSIIRAYHNQIINVHPSLIPSFCGEGFYGLRVHEAALARGVKFTGATVHFVNEVADDGPINFTAACCCISGRYTGSAAKACHGTGRVADSAAGSEPVLQRTVRSSRENRIY